MLFVFCRQQSYHNEDVALSFRKVIMEQQIQDLVASIRKEGIDAAKAEAERIIAEAEAKAGRIIEDAEKEKERLLEDAKRSIDTERSSAQASIRQAARDVSLSLRKSIEDTYSAILRADTENAMHGEALVTILSSVLGAEMTGKDIEISESDMKALGESLTARFADRIKEGLEFRPSQAVSSGFRIAEKDGSGYIDMTSESASDLIMPYLSAALRTLIKG